MNTALKQLFEGSSPDKATIDAYIQTTSFPIVNSKDVTFVYRGPADAVNLRCWVSGLDTAQPLQRMAETDVWAATIEWPKGSRVEYKFEVIINGTSQLILDPLNPVIAHDPFGANSVCQAFGYERPKWTLPDPDARPGSLQTLQLHSKAFDDLREIQVYLPATFRKNRQYPLLVVHDGLDYLRYAELKVVLDNLIHSLSIPSMVVAMTQSPDRLKEYAGDDQHAAFLAEDLLPFMAKQFPLRDEARARGILGASFGAVAALHAAWKYPNLYGNLLLQSGSFAFSDLGRHKRSEVFDPVVKFMNTFREQPGWPADKIYMSCGIYESLIYENRSLVPRLQAQGIEVRFEEARDAHNWENWRDRLSSGLSWLFPGPVWVVYD